MTTKDKQRDFDCFNRALPDEPTFTLLARDPDFERLVREWAVQRLRMIACGERPESDRAAVDEAAECAHTGAAWRKANNGKWRAVS